MKDSFDCSGRRELLAASGDLNNRRLRAEEGHGLFAIVVAKNWIWADVRHNGYISTIDLAGYVDDEVPKMAEKLFKLKAISQRHGPRQAFPIVSAADDVGGIIQNALGTRAGQMAARRCRWGYRDSGILVRGRNHIADVAGLARCRYPTSAAYRHSIAVGRRL